MLFPSKFTSFEESTISKMVLILEKKDTNEITVSELYAKFKKKFKTIDEFIFVLDVLYAMDYIEIENEVVKYVN